MRISEANNTFMRALMLKLLEMWGFDSAGLKEREKGKKK